MRKEFFEQPNEIIFRSFSSILKIVSGGYYEARGKKVNNIINEIKTTDILKKTTIGGCFVEKIAESILISKENNFKI